MKPDFEKLARDLIRRMWGQAENKNDKWADIDAAREALQSAYEQGRSDERERCVMAARLAMVDNDHADELTCSICASEIRNLGDSSE